MDEFKNKVKQLFSNMVNEKNDDYNFILPETDEPPIQESSASIAPTSDKEPQHVFPSVGVNLEYMKVKYNSLINSDVILREFTLTARNKQYKAFLAYIDGMVDSEIVNNFALSPLMRRNRPNIFDEDENFVVSEAISNNVSVRKVRKFNLEDYIYNSLIPQNNIVKEIEFSNILAAINMGNCVIFVDTLTIAFNLDVKGFKQRSIQPPANEIVIRGSQESFNEVVRTNTSMLRRLVNNENLVIESIAVGKLSKTSCAVCYLKNVANSDLVAEVKYRLNNVNVDYLISSGQLEQLIEDNGKYSLPQMLATERPDKATNYLLEGRVVVIVNGSPYSLIMPATFVDFLTSPEDINLKYQFANLLKLVRIVAVLLTLLLPGFYVAITNFHQELIPTELLFTIVASRESVPLPIIFEIIVMELSFELIREAGLRIPTPVGPTIGIVGALVLGQAAVEASLVSPILIIIVAITGIASFAIPDFSLGFHCRISRFAYIILGYLGGFLGIAFGLFFHFIILCSIKSFGVSYLEPFVPITHINGKGFFLSPAWKRENRADYLNTKRKKKQEHISMKWKYPNK